MKLLIGNNEQALRIIEDGDELPPGWRVLGEFIPLGSEKEIGKKDAKGVEIKEGNIMLHSGMSFDVVEKKEHPVAGGVIVGYFIPDGAQVLQGKLKTKP